MRRLLDKCPEESNTLQSFSESHLIGHDTPILVVDHHAGGTFVQKLGASLASRKT